MNNRHLKQGIKWKYKDYKSIYDIMGLLELKSFNIIGKFVQVRTQHNIYSLLICNLRISWSLEVLQQSSMEGMTEMKIVLNDKKQKIESNKVEASWSC